MKFFIQGLGLLFIGLKLTNYIDWSWWLVLLPIYSGAVIAASYIIAWGICRMVMSLYK